jgi:hypothetical protein
VTQYSPSICCDLPPRQLIERCSLRLTHGSNKKKEQLLIIRYEMEPAEAVDEFFSRFFDAFYSLLEVYTQH